MTWDKFNMSRVSTVQYCQDDCKNVGPLAVDLSVNLIAEWTAWPTRRQTITTELSLKAKTSRIYHDHDFNLQTHLLSLLITLIANKSYLPLSIVSLFIHLNSH